MTHSSTRKVPALVLLAALAGCTAQANDAQRARRQQEQ
jgi:hypothetical protein